MKRAFEVTEALTYSAEQEKFIYVQNESDVPKRDKDFECTDYEVKDTVLLSREEAQDANFAWGIHQKAREILFLNWEKQREFREKYNV